MPIDPATGRPYMKVELNPNSSVAVPLQPAVHALVKVIEDGEEVNLIDGRYEAYILNFVEGWASVDIDGIFNPENIYTFGHVKEYASRTITDPYAMFYLGAGLAACYLQDLEAMDRPEITQITRPTTIER